MASAGSSESVGADHAHDHRNGDACDGEAAYCGAVVTVNEDKGGVVADRGHLPECPQYCHWRDHFDDYWCNSDCTTECICDRLRDCEERVRDEATIDALTETK